MSPRRSATRPQPLRSGAAGGHSDSAWQIEPGTGRPMSIINRVLQDLDRRQGTSDPDATLAMSQVRTVPSARKDREWFWRIIAVLMIAAVGWVGWIAWQLQPREPVVTEQALRAAENAQRKPAPVAQAKAPEQKPAAESMAPEKPTAQAGVDSLKLAPAIEAPIRDQPAKPAAREAAKAPAKEAAAPKAKEPAPAPAPVAASKAA